VVASHPVRYAFREYVAHDDASSTKHEYLEGQIYAMAGGTPEHSAMIGALAARLAEGLRGGPCRLHSSDLRVRVRATGLTTYPDLTVVCGAWERDTDDPNTITNPALVVEVLSPSTERYDRTEKLTHYQRIPSLRACILLAHDRREMEVHARPVGGEPWVRSSYGPGQRVELAGLAALDVDGIYDEASEPIAG